ncbi:MAG: cyclase family protein [Candidatus Omnitrophota bacterium]|nr:cyclase family protein [Candidatus Omnitrophota bacterium]
MVSKNNKWIDATLPINTNMISWPSDPMVEVVEYKEISKGASSNVSLLKMGSHTGTHIDAPRHFFNNGVAIDKMPADVMIGFARVVEMSDYSSIYVHELKSKNIRLKERVILRTQNSKARWRQKRFSKDFVSLTLAAAEYLISKKIKLVGIDSLSVGGYAHPDAKAVHKALLAQGIWIVEGLDLSRVKPGVYDMLCLPLRIYQADAAPARVFLRQRE